MSTAALGKSGRRARARVIGSRVIGSGVSPADLAGALGFLALIGLQLLHHDLWRDEAQAWEIAVASTSPLDLFHRLRFEGHPGLWHLLLWLPARLTHDPRAMQLLQAAIGGGVGSLIWLASPFRRPEKLLLSGSYYLLFEYGVMSRSYGLGVLLALAAIWCWTRERRVCGWIFLGLVANTSAFGVLLALTLAAWTLWDRRTVPWSAGTRELSGMAVLTVLLVVAAATMLPAPGTVAALQQQIRSPAVRATLAFVDVSRALLPISFAQAERFWDPLPFQSLALYPPLMLPLGFLVAQTLRGERSMVYPLAGLAIAIGVLGLATVIPSARHVGTFFVATVALAWIAAARGKLGRGAFLILLGLNAVGGAQALYGQTLRPFSHARAAAEWLRLNGLDHAFIVGDADDMAVPVASYLDRAFYDPACDCETRYVEWTGATADWRQRGSEDNGRAIGGTLRRLLATRPSLILMRDSSRSPLSPEAVEGLSVRALVTIDGPDEAREGYTIYAVERPSPGADRSSGTAFQPAPTFATGVSSP